MFKRLRQSFKKKELDDKHKDEEFERGDFLAILLALAMYMVPAALLIFGLIALMILIVF